MIKELFDIVYKEKEKRQISLIHFEGHFMGERPGLFQLVINMRGSSVLTVRHGNQWLCLFHTIFQLQSSLLFPCLTTDKSYLLPILISH